HSNHAADKLPRPRQGSLPPGVPGPDRRRQPEPPVAARSAILLELRGGMRRSGHRRLAQRGCVDGNGPHRPDRPSDHGRVLRHVVGRRGVQTRDGTGPGHSSRPRRSAIFVMKEDEQFTVVAVLLIVVALWLLIHMNKPAPINTNPAPLPSVLGGG